MHTEIQAGFIAHCYCYQFCANSDRLYRKSACSQLNVV